MSSFTTEPWFRLMPDGRTWKVVRGFTYHIGSKTSKNKVVIRAGFITDFASVPRIFWSIIPPTGRYGKAAVIHDWLYQHKTDTKFDVLHKIFSKERKRADDIFKEAMQVLNVKKWRIFIMYWGVRVGGWIAWTPRESFPVRFRFPSP